MNMKNLKCWIASFVVFSLFIFSKGCIIENEKDNLDSEAITISSEEEEITIDYSAIDPDTYKGDFDSLPLTVKTDLSMRAGIFVKAMDFIRNFDPKAKIQNLPNPIKVAKMGACILKNCWRPMVACVKDDVCKSQLMSLGDCISIRGGSDEMMRCFITTLSAPCDGLLSMMTCWGDSGCMSVPVPNCALPTNKNQIAPVTLKDFEGDWYVVRGLSSVYDCWNCQRYTFTQLSENISQYLYTYFPTPGSPVTIPCTTTAIPWSDDEDEIMPGRFRVDYLAYGLPGADNWFVLANPKDYLLIYYCGASSMDSYTGGIILSRSMNTAIPKEILDIFENAIKNAGISDPVTLDDFGTPDNSQCNY